MPPKRVQRPRSSSSEESSSDSDAPMEVSISAAKSNVLQKQQFQSEALDKLEAERKIKAAERAAEIRITQEKKRRRLVRQEKKKSKLAGDDDEEDDSDDDQQFVQLAPVSTAVTITDDGDFIFDAEDLLEATAIQTDRKEQRELFSMDSASNQTKTAQQALNQKIAQQKRIAEMLKAENAVTTTSKVLSDKSRKHGKFQVVSTKDVTSQRAIGVGGQKRAPSAKDLLAMAHGFTAGTRETYSSLKLQHVPRQHADADRRFAKTGVSNAILNKGHTTEQKLAKERAGAKLKKK